MGVAVSKAFTSWNSLNRWVQGLSQPIKVLWGAGQVVWMWWTTADTIVRENIDSLLPLALLFPLVGVIYYSSNCPASVNRHFVHTLVVHMVFCCAWWIDYVARWGPHIVWVMVLVPPLLSLLHFVPKKDSLNYFVVLALVQCLRLYVTWVTPKMTAYNDEGARNLDAQKNNPAFDDQNAGIRAYDTVMIFVQVVALLGLWVTTTHGEEQRRCITSSLLILWAASLRQPYSYQLGSPFLDFLATWWVAIIDSCALYLVNEPVAMAINDPNDPLLPSLKQMVDYVHSHKWKELKAFVMKDKCLWLFRSAFLLNLLTEIFFLVTQLWLLMRYEKCNAADGDCGHPTLIYSAAIVLTLLVVAGRVLLLCVLSHSDPRQAQIKDVIDDLKQLNNVSLKDLNAKIQRAILFKDVEAVQGPLQKANDVLSLRETSVQLVERCEDATLTLEGLQKLSIDIGTWNVKATLHDGVLQPESTQVTSCDTLVEKRMKRLTRLTPHKRKNGADKEEEIKALEKKTRALEKKTRALQINNVKLRKKWKAARRQLGDNNARVDATHVNPDAAQPQQTTDSQLDGNRAKRQKLDDQTADNLQVSIHKVTQVSSKQSAKQPRCNDNEDDMLITQIKKRHKKSQCTPS